MYALNAIRYGGVLMSDWKDNAVKDEYGNPDISLCKNCWCMTHTLVGNVCGKCKRPKHIVDVIGDENIGGESVSLKELKR